MAYRGTIFYPHHFPPIFSFLPLSMASAAPPALALYRASSLGTSFFAALSHLVSNGSLSRSELWRALQIFDEAFCDALATKTNKISMQGTLLTYRHCDGVWNLVAAGGRFTGPEGILESKKFKIVACESRGRKRKSTAG